MVDFFTNKAARAVFLGLIFLTLATPCSWAWGREGHRLTALVAEAYLTPEAKAQIKELLGSESLADVAPWADSYRADHPETGAWHYVDIPKSAIVPCLPRTQNLPGATA